MIIKQYNKVANDLINFYTSKCKQCCDYNSNNNNNSPTKMP